MLGQKRFIRYIQVLLVLTCICTFFSCSPKDPPEIAREVARGWTENNIESISKSISAQVADNNPLVATAIAAAISNEIKQRISWQYSQPEKLSEDRYGVIAKASVPLEIPLLGNYHISLNYNLVIDTSNKQVLNATMDTGSFAMTKQ